MATLALKSRTFKSGKGGLQTALLQLFINDILPYIRIWEEQRCKLVGTEKKKRATPCWEPPVLFFKYEFGSAESHLRMGTEGSMRELCQKVCVRPR